VREIRFALAAAAWRDIHACGAAIVGDGGRLVIRNAEGLDPLLIDDARKRKAVVRAVVALDALRRIDHPATPAEVAEVAGLEVDHVAADLAELRGLGLVTTSTSGRGWLPTVEGVLALRGGGGW
jgi:hypothetical protein